MTAPFPCLILTPWMALHQIRPWQKAIAMAYVGEINVLEKYVEEARSPSISIRFPAVGQLVKQMSRDKHDVKYSRSNLYARDNHTCQYCGVKSTTLTLAPRKIGFKKQPLAVDRLQVLAPWKPLLKPARPR